MIIKIELNAGEEANNFKVAEAVHNLCKDLANDLDINAVIGMLQAQAISDQYTKLKGEKNDHMCCDKISNRGA